MNRGRNWTVAGGALLLVGALFPWAAFISAEELVMVQGYERAGIVSGCAGLALILLAIYVKDKAGRWYAAAVLLLPLLAGLIAALDMRGTLVAQPPPEELFRMVGIGIYVTFLGAALGLFGGLRRAIPRGI